MVMLAHLFIIEKKYSQDTILPEMLNFGMAGVDIFFVISGFIMVYVTHKWQSGAARHVPQFLFARIFRIYPLYWFVSLPLLILYFLLPDLVFSASSWNEPHLLKSFFLWPDVSFPLLEIGWTLIHEMSFYLIFSLILIAPRRIRPMAICIWALCVILAFAMGAPQIGPVSRILSHPLTLEFCLGALLAYGLINPRSAIKPQGGYRFIALSLAIFALSVMAFQQSGHNTPGMGWPRVGSFGVSALILLMGAYILECRGKLAPSWCVKIGDWSYSLYLTHVLTLSLLGRIWSYFDHPSIWDNMLILPLMVILTVILAGSLHHLIEAPFMKTAKYIQKKLFSRT